MRNLYAHKNTVQKNILQAIKAWYSATSYITPKKIKTQKQTWNDSTFKSQITRGKRTVAVCWSEYFRYCNKSVRLRKRLNCVSELLSVLWRYLLGGRNGIRPVKKWVVGCWRGCLERDADLHMAQLMPLPRTVSCFSKIQIGFTFLVPAYPGSPGKRAFNGCVCVVSWNQP